MNNIEVGWGGVDWMHLAQGRDQWRYWTSGFRERWGISCPVMWVSASHKELCSI